MTVTVDTVRQVERGQGALVSAVTALGLAVAMIVLQLVSFVIGWVSTLASVTGLFDLGPGNVLGSMMVVAIPFAVGFFLSLWLVAPITARLRVGAVLVRAIIATAIGAAVMLVVSAVLAMLGGIGLSGSIFGNSFPGTYDVGSVLNGFRMAFTNALHVLVAQLPLGVLAGVLLWVWRRDRLSRHPSSGGSDEV